jgi:hypothetical protein
LVPQAGFCLPSDEPDACDSAEAVGVDMSAIIDIAIDVDIDLAAVSATRKVTLAIPLTVYSRWQQESTCADR